MQRKVELSYREEVKKRRVLKEGGVSFYKNHTAPETEFQTFKTAMLFASICKKTRCAKGKEESIRVFGVKGKK